MVKKTQNTLKISIIVWSKALSRQAKHFFTVSMKLEDPSLKPFKNMEEFVSKSGQPLKP